METLQWRRGRFCPLDQDAVGFGGLKQILPAGLKPAQRIRLSAHGAEAPCSLRKLRSAIEALVPRCERQQGDVPGLLDGAGQAALVRGANAGETPGHDLAALGHKALQQTDIAVRDRVNLLGAELADLLAAEELAASAGTAGGTSAGAAGRPAAAGAGSWAGTGARTAFGWPDGTMRPTRTLLLEFHQTLCFLFTLLFAARAGLGRETCMTAGLRFQNRVKAQSSWRQMVRRRPEPARQLQPGRRLLPAQALRRGGRCGAGAACSTLRRTPRRPSPWPGACLPRRCAR
jgi:hypothetical protein